MQIHRRWPLILLALGLPLALALWVGSGGATGGAAAPCSEPLSWHLGELDDRFGLTRPEAEAAIREAVSLWEVVAGRPLFRAGPGGLTVHFTFDERQERVQERTERLGRLDPRVEELRARQAALDAEGHRLAGVGMALEADARDYQERRRVHNRTVSDWNGRGGAPPAVAEELLRGQGALEALRRELQGRREAFEARERGFRREVEELQRDIDAHNVEAEALDRDFAGGMVESGRYSAITRNGRVVEREIRIFRFDGADDLTLVLAHELGHALGMDHTADAGAVMSEVSHRQGPPRGTPRLTDGDRQLLESLCR